MPDFASTQLIKKIVSAQKEGLTRGITSICSSNHYVLRAGLQCAISDQSSILVESTCNQVNQDGGYTGMVPAQFTAYVADLALENEFTVDKVLLGGDHLGPNPWKDHKAERALAKAKVLVRDYVKAGYRKIHLDTSMACADDQKNVPLDIDVEAGRAADLCQVSEDAWHAHQEGDLPVYVIGTEVPVPGGAESDQEALQITSPDRARRSLDVYQQVFTERGLADAWERVIALVVQPGVEFSQFHIHEYNSESAKPLADYIEQVPGIIYEAHSTDYQLPDLLKEMVRDHFAILKVGPALTFAFREAVFALAKIEKEWYQTLKKGSLSNLVDVIDQVMVENPADWQRYYEGNSEEKALARKFSFSDRIRYYWPNQKVENALDRLISNLNQDPIPIPLLSQYLPVQYQHIREGKLENKPDAIILDHIQEVYTIYRYACGH